MVGLKRVSGHSMEPKLRDGQLVVVSPSNSLKVGDIVVARLERDIIKTVREILGDSVYLSGTDIIHDKGWVDKSKIIGKATTLRQLIWPTVSSQ
jgi:SOS-response transcriptional repressor LexA